MASGSSISSNVCKICNVTTGKYVCPRCNILYCSVVCYRSQEHSSCSEEFYRQCVQEELLQTDEKEGSKSMQEILQRMHQQEEEDLEEQSEEDLEGDSDDSSEGNGEDLATRLAGVNLDDADSVWEKLSKEEKLQFQSILTSGDPSDIIPVWEPWWTYRIPSKPLVMELDEDRDVDNSFMKKCPEHRNDIPALADPTKVNQAVRYGIENVLLAFALMARYYVGDYLGDLRDEAAQTLMDLSSSLSQGQNFTDRATAIASVQLEATQNLGMTEENIILGREDLEHITQGPGEDFSNYYILSVLSDSIKLLAGGNKNKKINCSNTKGEFSLKFVQPTEITRKWTKKQIMSGIKKLEFYIAWTRCQI